MVEELPSVISESTYIQSITQIRQQKSLPESKLLNSQIQCLDIMVDSRHTWPPISHTYYYTTPEDLPESSYTFSRCISPAQSQVLVYIYN